MAREIEVCGNPEWMVVYGPLSDLGLETTVRNEAHGEWFAETIRRIESAIPDVRCVRAASRRLLCHDWNGANTFRRKESGLGTFDEFDDGEWETAVEIAEAVAAERKDC